MDQELEEGVRSVAVPVRDRDQRAVAAMDVSTHASRVTLEVLRHEILPEAKATAERISADLAVRR